MLVSNAAVNPTITRILDVEDSVWDKIFDVNVKSAFLLAKEALAHLKKQAPSSSIVFVSSIGGYVPSPLLAVYSVSKTALIALAKAASKDLTKKGIPVNCLALGLIKTRFSSANASRREEFRASIPMGRMEDSDEMASVVAFLVSDDASYITAETIVASGNIIKQISESIFSFNSSFALLFDRLNLRPNNI